jgi:predicted nucleic acid-binding protein
LTLVDSNILIDVLSRDPAWYDWSASCLAKYSERGPIVIIDVIFAEICAGFERVNDVEQALAALDVEHIATTRQSLFRAATAFRSYRRKSGAKSNVLPDFFVGAHAEVEGIPLLTRDQRRYRTYFPEAQLIAPENP